MFDTNRKNYPLTILTHAIALIKPNRSPLPFHPNLFFHPRWKTGALHSLAQTT